jgi:6-phosphogluconate dehydrogenase (decarboxylating)
MKEYAIHLNWGAISFTPARLCVGNIRGRRAPAPVLSAALYQRFGSRGEEDFGDKLLSAMRFEFGGQIEKKQ